MRAFVLRFLLGLHRALSYVYLRVARLTPAQDPAPAEPVVDGPKQLRVNLEQGREAFNTLIASWYVNWHNTDNPEIPQPDRAGLFVAADTVYGLSMRAWVRERGGLIGAIVNTFLERNLIDPQDPRLYEVCHEIAARLVQTSAALGGGREWEGLVEYEDWKAWNADVDRARRASGALRGPPKSGRMVADVVNLNNGPDARSLGLI